jgi:hypothetical protein
MTTDTSKPTSRQEHAENLVMRYKGAINALGYALKALVESSKPARIGSTYSDAALQSLDDSNKASPYKRPTRYLVVDDAGIPDEVSEAAVAAAHASRLAVAAIDAARDAIVEATKANSAAFYASVASLIATKPPAEAVVLADAVYAVRQAEKAELAAIDALIPDEPRL